MQAKEFKNVRIRIKTLAVVTILKLPRNTHTFCTDMYLVFRVKLTVKHKGPAAGHPWQRCSCKERTPPAVPYGMQFSFHCADPECHSKNKPNSSSLYPLFKNVPKLLVLITCLNFSLKGKIVILLISFLSTRHKLEISGKRSLNWENTSITPACRQVCAEFLDYWLMWEDPGYCGGCQPWAGGLRW